MAAPGIVDPGDQPVRTAMAWSRTLLGIVGVCVLLVRGVWIRTGSGLAVLALAPALAAAGITLARQRSLAAPRPGVAAVATRGALAAVLVIGAATVALLLSGT